MATKRKVIPYGGPRRKVTPPSRADERTEGAVTSEVDKNPQPQERPHDPLRDLLIQISGQLAMIDGRVRRLEIFHSDGP